MNQKTSEILSILAILLSLIAITAAGDVSRFWANVQGQPQLNESATLIAGQNIALSQNTTNKTITITGAATWTLSVINSSEINVDNIFVSGGVFNPQNESYEMGWQHTVNTFWMYLYKRADEKLSSVVYSENLIYFYICYYASANCFTHELEISDGSVAVHGDFYVNDKNIETELVKTSVKAFQADYLNLSNIFSDIIIIPQNINLTNITVIIENTANTTNKTLNFSLERFTNYPTTKETIFSSSFNQSVNYMGGLQYSFNENDVLLLNYTTYINVSKSSSMFKFKAR